MGSARSDYGKYAYGRRLNEKGLERDWWDKTIDEVTSWFGDEEAQRRRRWDEKYNRNRDRNYGRRFYGTRLGTFPDEAAPYYPMSAANYVEWQDWQNLRARDLMTDDVVTVFPNDSIQYAARLMRDEDCGALPVVDRYGRLLGMITDRDITCRLVAEGYEPTHLLVSDCMTQEAFACHFNDSLITCLRSFSRHQIRRMPIVNDRNQVIGIISQADIARHAAAHTGTGERRAFSDVMCAVSEPTDEPYS